MVVYTVYADNLLIHHSESTSPDVKLIAPKLTMEENSSGSFSFTIPPSNVGYNFVKRITTEIVIKRQTIDSQTGFLGKEKEIWSGRVIDEQEDFFTNRQITCEGALSYLNDTIQIQAKYENYTPESMLRALINKHNDRVDDKHRFKVGAVTVHDPDITIGVTNYETDFESTLDCINTKLLNTCGGHLVLRRNETDGFNYIDYLEEYKELNSQTIEFGKNLLEFSKSFDVSNICTVIIPLGARQEEAEVDDDMDSYLTVESVNSGSIYVTNETAVQNFGWIEKVVHFEDIEDANILLRRARRYLEDTQYEQLTLEVTAVDLHYLGVYDDELFELYDTVHCSSVPHGMDRIFPIKKIDILLDKPEDTKFTIGNNVIANTLSSTLTGTNRLIQSTFSSLPSTTSVLKEAKENADQIMRQLTNGYITTVIEGTDENAHSEALIISDNLDYTKSNKYWKWSMNGLAYYKNKTELNLALTMDGSIVADRILVGTLGKPEWGNYWNMETGEFILSPTNVKTDSTTTLNSYFNNKINDYDLSLNQQEVFNRLTNNGSVKGIIMSGGQLYINASYINAGTLSADYISGGVIKSKNETMTIDLDQNSISCNNLTINSTHLKINSDGAITSIDTESTHKLSINDGGIQVYYGSNEIGGIYSAWVKYGSSPWKGELQLHSNDILNIMAPELYINGSKAESSDTCYARASNGQEMHINFSNGLFMGYELSGDSGQSEWVSVITGIDDIWMSDNRINWRVHGVNLHFEEGIYQGYESWS